MGDSRAGASSAAAGAASLAAAGGLLPSSPAAFASKAYWATFFQARGGKAFEWYGEWPHFARNVAALLGPPPAPRILIIGCGNSSMSRSLYDAGYTEVTNIDFDGGVVAEMRARHAAAAPRMSWLELDATDMAGLADASFDAVLDKGTLDAMCPDASAECAARVARMATEVARVLRPGGAYAVITLGQEPVLAAWVAALLACSSGGACAWSGVDVSCFADGDVAASPLCPLFVSARRCVASAAGNADSGAAAGGCGGVRLAATVRVPMTLDAAGGGGARAPEDSASTRRAGGPQQQQQQQQRARPLLSFPVPLPPSEVSIVALTSGGGDGGGGGGGASAAVPLLAALAPLRWRYDAVRQLSTVSPGHYVALDVWGVDGLVPAPAAAAASGGRGDGRRAGASPSAQAAPTPQPLIVTPAGVRPVAAPPAAAGKAAASSASHGAATPRYRVAVVDAAPAAPASAQGSAPEAALGAAVLLVPRGREHEWSFSSRQGQVALASGAGYARLIFVTQVRSAPAPGGAPGGGSGAGVGGAASQAARDELGPVMSSLVPPSLRARGIPFLAVAEAEYPVVAVGSGTSALSGDFVVEDVAASDDDDDCGGGGGGAAGDGGVRSAATAGGDDADEDSADGGGALARSGGGASRRTSKKKAAKAARGGRAAAPSTPAVANSAAAAVTDGTPSPHASVGAPAAGPLTTVYRRARRRLVFLGYRNAVQSEALLVAGPASAATTAGGRRPAAAVRGAGAAAAGVLRPAALDPSALAFEYHRAMAAAAVLLSPALRPLVSPSAPPFRAAVIGLGGGGLPMFLASQLPALLTGRGAPAAVDVTAVELDPSILDVAERFFGFRAASVEALAHAAPEAPAAPTAGAVLASSGSAGGPACHVVVGDGLDFVAELAARLSSAPGATAASHSASSSASAARGDDDGGAAALRDLRVSAAGSAVTSAATATAASAGAAGDAPRPLHLLVVDVDAKDVSGAMTFPPPAFVAPAFLRRAREALCADGGVLLINVACRDAELLAATVADVVAVFRGAGASDGRPAGAVYTLDVGGDAVNCVVAAVRGGEGRGADHLSATAAVAAAEACGAAALAACIREFGEALRAAP